MSRAPGFQHRADTKLKMSAAAITSGHTKGENHFKAKLTESDILSILNALALGESMASLGKRYGVEESTIWHIAKGKTWKHITGGIDRTKTRGEVRETR